MSNFTRAVARQRPHTPGYLLVLLAALALELFNGNSQYLGLPIGPDRLALALGVVLFIRNRDSRLTRGWRPRLVHVLMLLLLLLCLVSAVAFGTIADKSAIFAIVDSVGLVPFAAFTLAPVIFRAPTSRSVLLATFVAIGIYLGATAVAEMTGLTQFVFPRYIADPTIGIHAGRARGPFVESAADGLAMTATGAVAAVALATWRRPMSRALAGLALTLDSVGIVLTLTRSVWIGAALATVLGLGFHRRGRRIILPLAGGAVVLISSALVLLPGLRSSVDARIADQGSEFDRLNANAAALRILEARPITGVGWHRFSYVETDWVRQASSYPITVVGIPVHNVALGYAAEVGLPGLLLWAGTLLAAGYLLVQSWGRGGAELALWRSAALAISASWLTVSMLAPITYPFPTVVLWLVLGVAVSPGVMGFSSPEVTSRMARFVRA